LILHRLEEQARQKRIDEVEEELQRIAEEEKRIKTLEQEAAAWQRARRIREYIVAVEERAATSFSINC
jgi:phosphopantetheine adenylyltransferase